MRKEITMNYELKRADLYQKCNIFLLIYQQQIVVKISYFFKFYKNIWSFEHLARALGEAHASERPWSLSFISFMVNQPLFTSYYLITNQAVYIQRNTEASSCNHHRSGKALSITYSECVRVTLGIHHAISMHHIVICGVSGSTIFFSHYLKKMAQFKKKKAIECKMLVLIFSTILVWNISHSKKNWARYNQKCTLIFM